MANATERNLLEQLRRNPGDQLILNVLADLALDAGDEAKSKKYRDAVAIGFGMRTAKNNRKQLNEQYGKAVAEIEAAEAKLRSSCTHPATWYTPDPSGNSDSSTACLVCGKEVR